MTVMSPAQMPSSSGRHFRKPKVLVLLRSRMLLGPGVKVVAQAETASSIKTDVPIGVSSLFQAGPVRPARRICKAR